MMLKTTKRLLVLPAGGMIDSARVSSRAPHVFHHSKDDYTDCVKQEMKVKKLDTEKIFKNEKYFSLTSSYLRLVEIICQMFYKRIFDSVS